MLILAAISVTILFHSIRWIYVDRRIRGVQSRFAAPMALLVFVINLARYAYLS